MTMYAGDGLLNLSGDEVVDRTIQVRAHTGNPSNNGTANGISGASVDHPAGEWTDAGSGRVQTNVDTEFGILSNTQANTVSHLSYWAGSTFLGWVALTSPVAVAANEEFTVDAGTIAIVYARSA